MVYTFVEYQMNVLEPFTEYLLSENHNMEKRLSLFMCLYRMFYVQQAGDQIHQTTFCSSCQSCSSVLQSTMYGSWKCLMLHWIICIARCFSLLSNWRTTFFATFFSHFSRIYERYWNCQFSHSTRVDKSVWLQNEL